MDILPLPKYSYQGKLPNEVDEHAAEEPEPRVDGRHHGDHVALDEFVVDRMISVVAVLNVARPQETDQGEEEQIEAHDRVYFDDEP